MHSKENLLKQKARRRERKTDLYMYISIWNQLKIEKRDREEKREREKRREKRRDKRGIPGVPSQWAMTNAPCNSKPCLCKSELIVRAHIFKIEKKMDYAIQQGNEEQEQHKEMLFKERDKKKNSQRDKMTHVREGSLY